MVNERKSPGRESGAGVAARLAGHRRSLGGCAIVVGGTTLVPLVTVMAITGNLRFGGFGESKDALPPLPSPSPLPLVSRIDCSTGGGIVPIPGIALILENSSDPSGPMVRVLDDKGAPAIISKDEGDHTRLDALPGTPGSYNISTGELLVGLEVGPKGVRYTCGSDVAAAPARVGRNTNLG